MNLNTTSARRANAIAFDIREAGRVKREGGKLTGKIVTDANGDPVKEPGKLKNVKGIGWYIEEYGVAQLSLNLTDIDVTPVHVAFDEACKSAQSRGIRVTGSELVGLIPKQAMLDAADHFLRKQERSLGIAESEKMKIAVKSLGLDDLAPFDPQKRVIEYMLARFFRRTTGADESKGVRLRSGKRVACPRRRFSCSLLRRNGSRLGTMVAT